MKIKDILKENIFVSNKNNQKSVIQVQKLKCLI